MYDRLKRRCCLPVQLSLALQFTYDTTATTVYGHYTAHPVLAGTPVKNWRILLEQSFTARMPLLMAASIFGLGRRC